MPPKNDFWLNDVRIDPRRLSVTLNEEERTVEPLAMRILLVLKDAAGQVVTREELIQAVWPDGYAGEGSLSRAIWTLRQVLGDDARTPTFIETVPRIGYRLKAVVRRPDSSTPSRVDQLERSNRRLRGAVAVLAVALFVVSAGWGVHALDDGPRYEQFLKVKRPDGTVDSLHFQSETPIAFSSNLLGM